MELLMENFNLDVINYNNLKMNIKRYCCTINNYINLQNLN